MINDKCTLPSFALLTNLPSSQLANAASEAASIQQMAKYVAGITVEQAGKAVQPSVLHPQIGLIFDHIKAELG